LEVAPDSVASKLLSKAASEVGPDVHPYDLQETITKLRSRIACGEDYGGFGDADIEILERYRKLLTGELLLDFEGIVEDGLELVREHSWIRDMVAARFPWVLVDEYQDLGGPLHRIVECLASASIRIFAVGDPDQSIYDFAGAEPAYLTGLSERSDFGTVRLKFNYRSGRRLIAASQAALAPPEPRGYEPDPSNQDHGEVLFFKSASIEEQPSVIVGQVIPELVARGVPFEEMAIFYRKKGEFLRALVAELTRAHIPFIMEKNDKYPKTRITRWLQHAMQVGLEFASGSPPDVDFAELEDIYQSILSEAGVSESRLSVEARTRLFETFTQLRDPDLSMRETLELLDRRLELSKLFSTIKVDLFGDKETWKTLLNEVETNGALAGYTLRDFSLDGKLIGKIMLTTHHSSKGRQFDAVVIPELVQEVFPAAPWVEKRLKQERRLFYVAFTRAKKIVSLVYGSQYRKRDGSMKRTDVSQFVREVHKRLQSN
jgi:superfamily I DNA/RNA helicase